MSRVIQPRSYADTTLDSRKRFFTQYRPPWNLLVGSGYVQGARPQQFHQCIEGLGAGAGEVAFMYTAGLTPEAPIPELTSSANFYAVSNNPADAGQMWQASGVGPTGEAHDHVFFLTGTTPVDLGAWLHINSLYSLSHPAVNLGDIAISTNAVGFPTGMSADTVQLIAVPGDNIGRNATLRAPNGQWFVVEEIDLTADRSDGIEVSVYRRVVLPSFGPEIRVRFGQWFVFQTAFQKSLKIPIVIGPGGSVAMTVERSSAGVGDVNGTINALYYIGSAEDPGDPKGGDPAGWPALTSPPTPTEF